MGLGLVFGVQWEPWESSDLTEENSPGTRIRGGEMVRGQRDLLSY